MAKLEFENLEFEEKKGMIEVTLLRNFYFIIDRRDILAIGKFRLRKKSIEFPDAGDKQASGRFNFLISEGIKSLKNRLNNRPAVYVHRNSGIPLMGTLFFGIVDRGTTIIEVKPITSCNLNCIFCSVDEGISGRKANDFVVEEEYLVEELKKLLDFKQSSDIEIFINPHGEPLLYADMIKLVSDIKKIGQVRKVAIATNAALLTENLADELEKAGLDQLNLSINSLDEKNARLMAGTKGYDIKKIKKVIQHILSRKKMDIVLAPVWVPGINDRDIEDIAEYCRKAGCEVGIQKYVSHKKGRNPKGTKEMEWEEFFREMQEFQDRFGPGMLFKAPERTKEMPEPFRTGDMVNAVVVSSGRSRDEMIASAKERAITVYGCNKSPGESARIRIIKSKNNVFYARPINA